MAGAAAGVVGPRDQAAVGEELPGRGEAGDAVDLAIDSERGHLAEAEDPEQPLDLGVGDQGRVERAFEAGDLRLEQLDLGGVTAGLNLVKGVQLGTS